MYLTRCFLLHKYDTYRKQDIILGGMSLNDIQISICKLQIVTFYRNIYIKTQNNQYGDTSATSTPPAFEEQKTEQLNPISKKL